MSRIFAAIFLDAFGLILIFEGFGLPMWLRIVGGTVAMLSGLWFLRTDYGEDI